MQAADLVIAPLDAGTSDDDDAAQRGERVAGGRPNALVAPGGADGGQKGSQTADPDAGRGEVHPLVGHAQQPERVRGRGVAGLDVAPHGRQAGDTGQPDYHPAAARS